MAILPLPSSCNLPFVTLRHFIGPLYPLVIGRRTCHEGRMVFEAPISLSGALAPLARAAFRMIPRPLRCHRFFENTELKLNGNPLRQQFDAIVTEGDRHGQWLALSRSAALLVRLDIPHPGTEAGPDVWRAFLAHVIDAAEDGDMDRARQAKDVYGFVNAPTDFGAPTGAPHSEEDIDGPVGIVGPVIGESEAILVATRQDPGAGIHIAKLLSDAKTRAEADEIFDIFNDAEIKRNEAAVYAAYAAALIRFGNLLDASRVLVSADVERGLSKEELEEAMERFYYPKEEEEDDG